MVAPRYKSRLPQRPVLKHSDLEQWPHRTEPLREPSVSCNKASILALSQAQQDSAVSLGAGEVPVWESLQIRLYKYLPSKEKGNPSVNLELKWFLPSARWQHGMQLARGLKNSLPQNKRRNPKALTAGAPVSQLGPPQTWKPAGKTITTWDKKEMQRTL